MDRRNPPRGDVRARTRASRRLTLAIAAAAAGAALVPGAANAALQRWEPPDGKILSGAAVQWHPETYAPRFAADTGQPKLAVVHGYVDYLGSIKTGIDPFRSIDSGVMLSWRMMAGSSTAPGGTLTKVANGDIDAYLVQSAADVAAFDKPVFLRPYWEFTGNWFPWSTYDSAGNVRPGNSPAMFVKAWQRGRIIFDGGTRDTINARLTALGMPGLTVPGTTFPTAKAAWVWSTSKGGAKYASKGDRTAFYWPGDAYVDWIGASFHQYQNKTVEHWASLVNNTDPLARMNALYDFGVQRDKPFMYTEWALGTKPYGNGDDPKFVDDALKWLEARPRAKGQVWFDRDMGSHSHLINLFPNGRAMFTSHVTTARYTKEWRDLSPGGTVTPPPPPPPPPPAPTCTPKTSVTVTANTNTTLNFCDPLKNVVAKIKLSSTTVSGDMNPQDGRIPLTVKVGTTTARIQSTTYGYWFTAARPAGTSVTVSITTP